MNGKEEKKRCLFLGVALDGTALARSRTGGVYYDFKTYDHFRRLPGFLVDHDGVSFLSARAFGRMIKLHLRSLYLLILRGHRRYKYIFVNGTWTCPLFLRLSKLRGSTIVTFWYHRTSKQPEMDDAGQRLWERRERHQLKMADGVVVISKSTLRSMRELGFEGDNYVLAPPGLDKDVWIDRTGGYDPLQPGFRVICVTAVAPHKGLTDLLAAFADFFERGRGRGAKGHPPRYHRQ